MSQPGDRELGHFRVEGVDKDGPHSLDIVCRSLRRAVTIAEERHPGLTIFSVSHLADVDILDIA